VYQIVPSPGIHKTHDTELKDLNTPNGNVETHVKEATPQHKETVVDGSHQELTDNGSCKCCSNILF